MKIATVNPILLTVPLDPQDVISWSGGHIEKFHFCMAQVTTDNGLTGIGDTYGLGTFAPEIGAAIIAHYGNLLVGQDPTHVTELWNKLYFSSLYWGRSGAGVAALSAIENALWDLAGKIAGKPVWSLLGGSLHHRLPIYASGGMNAPMDVTIAEMETYRAQGYRHVKIRIGYGPETDRAKVEACRRALGPDIQLMVDAVQGHNPHPWSASEAVTVAQRIAPFDIAWFEEPCGAYDYDGYAHVRAKTPIPVAGGESSSTIFEFRHFFDRHALDVAQPDAAHCGGISELLRIATLAATYGIPVAPHSWGSAATTMANYHAAFAVKNCLMVEYPTISNPLRTAMLGDPLDIRDGYLYPPQVPGLGITLTPEIQRRYAYQPA